MHFKPKRYFFVFLFVVSASFLAESCAGEPAKDGKGADVRRVETPPPTGKGQPAPSAYVLRLFQRVQAIGRSIVKFEEEVLARLGKKRPVDAERVASRILSGRRQMISIRKLARKLEKEIFSTDPNFQKIQSLKGKIGSFVAKHKGNMAKFQGSGEASLQAAFAKFEDALGDIQESEVQENFQVKNLEAQF